jgi:hypothetical protein
MRRRGMPRRGRLHVQCPVRSVAVVMTDVDAKHRLKMAATGDEDPIQALASQRADEPLGEGIRHRRPDRGVEGLDAFRAEDVVE